MTTTPVISRMVFMILVSDLFKIGIGPSSSHTVGPMVAANQFIHTLQTQKQLGKVNNIEIDLYGSLAATGKGHATDTAILLGLMGHQAHSIDTSKRNDYLQPVFTQNSLLLAGQYKIVFDYDSHINWYDDVVMPYHPNALTVTAKQHTNIIQQQTYYSIGGGFVVNADAINSTNDDIHSPPSVQPPYPFTSAERLLHLCHTQNISISQLVMANEQQYQNKKQVLNYIDEVWQVMQSCVHQGCLHDGILPGGLAVKRRAKGLYQQLMTELSEYQQKTVMPSLLSAHNNLTNPQNIQSLQNTPHLQNPPNQTHYPTPKKNIDYLMAMDWVDLYALAVNEENANGGKVVTAPTNGAAGIIPAVLHYYRDFISNFSQQGVYDFFLTATAIGSLIKDNASISGAEVGCQGEVGSACAMAAAGLTQVLGGSVAQCLNAAEIGIEHNLGLTCDPIDGLVQVPCIERNAMGAVKAINAARLALRGDGQHFVSLDKAIETMKQTGMDMHDKYKETAKGGLALYAKNAAQNASLNTIPTATLGVSVNYSQC